MVLNMLIVSKVCDKAWKTISMRGEICKGFYFWPNELWQLMKEHYDNVETINYTIGSNTLIAKKCPKSRTIKMKPIISLVMGFFVRSQSKTSKPKNN